MRLFRNIQDMLAVYYSDFGARYIAKADAPIKTDTAGVYNPIYGAFAWSQFNTEANAWSVLPKNPWTESGWRVKTTRAFPGLEGGIAEYGVIPDAKKPVYQEIQATIKEIVHTFAVSSKQQYIVTKTTDDAYGSMEDERADIALEHVEQANKMLLTEFNTLAGDNLESIDRVVSSYDEVTNVPGYQAGDADIYGIDRDAAASWADAYVDHNAGVDRALDDPMVRTAINTLAAAGAFTQLVLTNDTGQTAMEGLYQDQARYQKVFGEREIAITVNGVETPKGRDVGMKVSTMYGIPVILSKDAPSDTIGRIYFLDTSNRERKPKPRLGIDIAAPPMYFESGLDGADRNPFSIGQMGTKGMYMTAAEVKCRFFAVQGKIRDLNG